MGLDESLSVTGGDRYEAVDQVRLIAVPKTMERVVSHKRFWGVLSYDLQALYSSACNLQSTGAECD